MAGGHANKIHFQPMWCQGVTMDKTRYRIFIFMVKWYLLHTTWLA